jgi:hypothetical protein
MAWLLPPPPAAPLSSFHDYYDDATRDQQYNRYYNLHMQSFVVPNRQNDAALQSHY